MLAFPHQYDQTQQGILLYHPNPAHSPDKAGRAAVQAATVTVFSLQLAQHVLLLESSRRIRYKIRQYHLQYKYTGQHQQRFRL